jgi:hypothetical protein
MKDKGCLVTASTADFFVTSLGEMFRKNMLLDCSSLDMRDVAEKNGFVWEEVCPLQKNENKLAWRWEPISAYLALKLKRSRGASA